MAKTRRKARATDPNAPAPPPRPVRLPQLAQPVGSPEVEARGGRVNIKFETSSELSQGVYANVMSVGSTDYDFVLTFGQGIPLDEEMARQAKEAGGVVRVPAKVRVVLPAILIPRLIEVLNSSLEAFLRRQGMKPPDEGTTK